MTARVKSVTGSQKLHSCHRGLLFLVLAAISVSTSAFAQALRDDSRFLQIQAEVICRLQLQPADSLCLKLNHLHLDLNLNASERLSLSFGWDPGHSQKPTWIDSYGVFGQRLPPRPSWLNRYALRWQLAMDMEVTIENWSSTALLPDASGLSFAQSLQDSGWDQSVLRLTLIKPEWKLPALSLVAGLSEGETVRNRDAKPYLGFLGRAQLATALELQAGGSYDADSLAPDALFWLSADERKQASRGFLAKRSALALILDGHHPFAQGLRLALGLQGACIQGPSGGVLSRQISAQEGPLDPTEILAEPFGIRSQIERRTLSFSASYLLLAQYLLAFHHQQLQVNLGRGAQLQYCTELDRDGVCLDSSNRVDTLRAQEMTYGLGRVDQRGWSLFLEYHSVRYDKLYELYHFAPEQDHRQQGLSLLQTRLTWSW